MNTRPIMGMCMAPMQALMEFIARSPSEAQAAKEYAVSMEEKYRDMEKKEVLVAHLRDLREEKDVVAIEIDTRSGQKASELRFSVGGWVLVRRSKLDVRKKKNMGDKWDGPGKVVWASERRAYNVEIKAVPTLLGERRMRPFYWRDQQNQANKK